MKRKILAIMLGFVLMLGTFTGCTVQDTNQNEQYKDREIKLTMYYYNAGYGEDYWEAMAGDYMANYDDKVYIDMVPKTDSPAMRTQITTNDCDADIVQLSVDMFSQTNSIENLDELYNMAPLGETVAIKDKKPDLYDFFAEKYGDNKSQTGHFRLASSGNGAGYIFAYNKTTLDGIFGADNYELPVTSQELFAFGDAMRDEGHFLMSTALGDTGGDYTVYLQQLWLAQLMGKEKYDHYYSAEAYNAETGSWDFCFEEPTMMTQAQQEIKDTYEQLHELFIGENEYLHPETKSLNHLFNNRVFSGAGYGLRTEKTAFLYIGSWLENEMKNVKGANQDQTYGAIRTPVNSAIVNYLSTPITDAQLAGIIRAIDAGKDFEATKTAVDGIDALTQADFNKIYEARKMIVTIRCSEIVVPKLASNEAWKKEHIFKFLRYLTSERANVVAANKLGGLNMTAYSSPIKDTDLTVTRSLFVQNIVDIAKDTVVIDTAQINKISKKVLPLSTIYVPGGENLAKYLFDRTTATAQDSDSMYTNLYKAATDSNLWKTKVDLYKLEMGIN